MPVVKECSSVFGFLLGPEEPVTTACPESTHSLLQAIAKLRATELRHGLVRMELDCQWTDFYEICYLGIFGKSVVKIRV